MNIVEGMVGLSNQIEGRGTQVVSQEFAQVLTQPSAELVDLTAQLGVPEEHRVGYIRSVAIALGPESQPTRTLDFLRFKTRSTEAK